MYFDPFYYNAVWMQNKIQKKRKLNLNKSLVLEQSWCENTPFLDALERLGWQA